MRCCQPLDNYSRRSGNDTLVSDVVKKRGLSARRVKFLPCIPPMLSPSGHWAFVEEGVPSPLDPSPRSRVRAADDQNTSGTSWSPEAAYTELQNFLQSREQKRRLYPCAVLVGALASWRPPSNGVL